MRQDYRLLCYENSIEGKAWLPFPKREIEIEKERQTQEEGEDEFHDEASLSKFA